MLWVVVISLAGTCGWQSVINHVHISNSLEMVKTMLDFMLSINSQIVVILADMSLLLIRVQYSNGFYFLGVQPNPEVAM